MGSGCSSAQSTTLDPNVLSLAHYEIHRVVGQGGFGKVNAVIRKRTEPPQWFALKTLAKDTIVRKKCTRMIWNERNLLAVIQSPHLVLMHHAFQDELNCYVVMDLLLGGDLKFHLGTRFKGGVPESGVRFYVAGLLLALRYLHTHEILHRDVKPDNVILDNDGYPRLTDLGISVHKPSLRYNGSSGTTNYMAPELFLGTGEHGVAADLFSVGVLAFELLCGKRPWPSMNIKALVEASAPTLFTEPTPQQLAQSYYPSEVLDDTSTSRLSRPCRAFLRDLLHPVEQSRLSFEGGVDAVMQHDWFLDFDWIAYSERRLQAPFTPTIDPNKANCDTAVADFDDVLGRSSHSASSTLTEEEKRTFDGFEYNVDLTHSPP